MSTKSIIIYVSGMHCSGCEQTIEHALSYLPGIITVSAEYKTGQVRIGYSADMLTLQQISRVIEYSGYLVNGQKKPLMTRVFDLLIFFILFSCVALLALWGKGLMPDLLPTLHANMSYSLLFGIGFLTGFHCIGMCGSFILSYSKNSQTLFAKIIDHGAYAVGKMVSYSVIGAGFALMGATLIITMHMRGVAALAAAVFLFLFGLKMLNLFPRLQAFGIHLPSRFSRKISQQNNAAKNPLVIGLLSGLILGCGPLQAMYIMAAGTGNPLEGASLLFFFACGTLIPLLGYGLFANVLPPSFMHQLVRVSGLLVMIMAIMMLNRGLGLTGWDKPFLIGFQQFIQDSIQWWQNFTSRY